MKLAVIIPAFNEQDSIAIVVNDINALSISNTEITAIVINDCSSDNTSEVVSKLDCILIDLAVNLGIGGAVQTGYRYAYDNNFDFAIQVDGDGQHPANEIPKLLNEAITNNINVVIGSRFIDNKGFQSSGIRRLGIGFLNKLIKLFTGLNILDNTSGFRLFDKKVLEVVQANYPDEYPEPESLILFSKKNFSIKEVAVEMKERQGGESSIRNFDQLYYMIKVSMAIFYTFIKTKK
ncbi:MAG: glycosyltransferase family 2 protein [Bacteroidetes bacterium]|nr:MAG: glycosyltransferase family 2 protein [Bacteroidota bacterium]